MASANKSEKVIRETVFSLSLSQEEAEALLAVTGLVEGNHRTSPREHTDAVYKALSKALHDGGYRTFPAAALASGAFRFKNYVGA